jgi:aryl-alcohol dehydrogenase-like predicted oxidoreductase
MDISKITLGTAQIGIDYGIANIDGKPNFKTAIKLLEFAWDNGINTFDTAPSYGNSEEIIGSFISSKSKKDVRNIVISSKLSKIELKEKISFENLYNHIIKEIFQSINNLKIKSIPIYLLHHAPDIHLKNGIVIECLNQIKEEGLIKKLGISVYDIKQVEVLLTYKEIDVIQVPFNLFDHRLIKTGLLKKLEKKKIIIFARSVYLQGLFFKSLNELPQDLRIAKKSLKKLIDITNNYQLDIAELAALFVRDTPEISSMVIGAESIAQVKKNVEILNKNPLNKEIREVILEDFAEVPKKIIDPRLWKI